LKLLGQAGVLNGDGGVIGQQHDQPLVVLAKRLVVERVGQVEVAQARAATDDRHAQEAAHDRVALPGEARRARVFGQVIQANGRVGFEHCTQQAQAARLWPHVTQLLRSHAGGDEGAQRAVFVGHAQRRVTRLHQLAGDVGDRLQRTRQAQFAGDGRGCPAERIEHGRAPILGISEGGRRRSHECHQVDLQRESDYYSTIKVKNITITHPHLLSRTAAHKLVFRAPDTV